MTLDTGQVLVIVVAAIACVVAITLQLGKVYIAGFGGIAILFLILPPPTITDWIFLISATALITVAVIMGIRTKSNQQRSRPH